MSSSRFAQSVLVRSIPLVAASWGAQQQQSYVGTSCEEAPKKKQFEKATCTKNVAHTHDTRLITLKLPSNWNETGQAVANVVVRAEFEGGVVDTGCCACCKCPPGTCSCPKGDNGCCGCCGCKGTCGCAKQTPSKQDALAGGCCACCKCGPETCDCPKKPNGCCACCTCEGTCGCAKAVPSSLVSAESSGKTLVARPYNPLSATSGDEVTLLVKRYGNDAQMGSKLHGLKPGDEIEVKGPNWQWTVPASGKIKKYVMIAGGTGITPIMQATQAILENDEHATVEWITFNKTIQDCLLMSEMALLKAKYPGRFFVYFYVETANDPTVPLFERTPDFEGKPTLELLAKVLPLPTDHNGDIKVCVCGRPGMTAAVAGPKTKDYKQGELGGILKELGFTKSQVWKF